MASGGRAMTDEPQGKDFFGIRPWGETARELVTGAKGALNRLFGPAADEFGLLLAQRVRFWRLKNAVEILKKADALLKEAGLIANPRVGYRILEEGSWCDDEFLQDMWAGLLASSCTDEGKDDSNLVFVHILSQMTSLEARLLSMALDNMRGGFDREGWTGLCSAWNTDFATLCREVDISDKRMVERALEHIDASLGLADVHIFRNQVTLLLGHLAAELCLRGRGIRLSLSEFFAQKEKERGG